VEEKMHLKSQVLQLPGMCQPWRRVMAFQVRIPAITISVRDSLVVLSAAVLVSAFILLSVWVAGLDARNAVSAASWGIAIVFLAFAIDSRPRKAVLQSLTALALVVLAWLQLTVAPEWVIATAALLAPWLAASLVKRL
jgi:hypothetical protein